MTAGDRVLPATCPLSQPGQGFDADDVLGASCPLTGRDLRPTTTTTGARGGKPVRHVRMECPQPCMTQWWEDSEDGKLSWAGSSLDVAHPDLAGPPPEVIDVESVPAVPAAVVDAYREPLPSEPLDLLAWAQEADDR